ncbi:MAG: SDR family oxidoreductase [Proteobacteria bacterium]|nr:SDR family oxidoreductase [Pseudomonadota bacterium]
MRRRRGVMHGYRPVVTMTAPHAPAATPPARPRHDRPVAIITGASAGIGAATAVELARTGHDLVLVARRRERLAEVAARASDAAKRLVRTEIVTADVSHAGTATRILDEAERAFGRFDVVYANAGYGLERPMHRMTSDELRAMFETNFFSSTELCNEAARRLIAAGRGGHLLMCSSCVAKFTLPSFGAYSASKAAQAHVARAMAYELRPHGIMVSSVHPVTTATEFFEVVREALEDGEKQQYAIHDLNKFFVQRPEKVARAIARTIGTSRTEIWTSLPTRVAAGVITAFPWLLDIAVRATRRR